MNILVTPFTETVNVKPSDSSFMALTDGKGVRNLKIRQIRADANTNVTRSNALLVNDMTSTYISDNALNNQGSYTYCGYTYSVPPVLVLAWVFNFGPTDHFTPNGASEFIYIYTTFDLLICGALSLVLVQKNNFVVISQGGGGTFRDGVRGLVEI